MNNLLAIERSVTVIGPVIVVVPAAPVDPQRAERSKDSPSAPRKPRSPVLLIVRFRADPLEFSAPLNEIIHSVNRHILQSSAASPYVLTIANAGPDRRIGESPRYFRISRPAEFERVGAESDDQQHGERGFSRGRRGIF